VVRASLIPVFVKQIVSQRNMLVVQPELQKLQKKYKGRNDPDSRKEFAEAQMALYKKHNTNPVASCIPLLIQMPIFTGLYFVLNDAQQNKAGVGLLGQDLAQSFSTASFFGAPLKDTFLTASNLEVQILAAVMIVLMTASQFITQKQILAKNQNPAVQTSQYMQTQKIMLYIFPIMFLITGISFPLALVFYWLTSNFWTMGQQFIVIRNMPTPGSQAYKSWEARQAKKAARKGKVSDAILSAETAIENAIEAPVTTQRAQPVSKARAKKKK
jgi:YidC/Oxa1 family membrane protein insertase